jgi:hypothetical protein
MFPLFPCVIETCIIEYACSPLELAKSATNLRALKRYMSEGLVIESIIEEALMHFVQKADVGVVKYMTGEYEFCRSTSLIYAALCTGVFEIAEALVTSDDEEAFEDAAGYVMRDAPIDMLKSLVDYFRSPEMSDTGEYIQKMLHLSVSCERVDVLEYMMECCELDIGRDQVMTAIRTGNVDILHMLDSYNGAPPDTRYRDVLIALVLNGYYDMLRELLARGIYRHEIRTTIDLIKGIKDGVPVRAQKGVKSSIDVVALRILEEYL